MSETQELRVVVAGVGGIGSWLSEGLARMLEYSAPGSALILIDGDTYEEKNKERQSFEGHGNKAEVKAAELAPLFPKTFIVPQAKWIVADDAKIDEVEGETEADGSEPAGHVVASKVCTEGAVVFAVVDNFKCRKDLCDAAQNVDDIDIFLGGNDEGLYTSVYHYQRRDGKDVTDHPAVWHPEYENPPDRNPGEMSCEERAKIEGGTQLIAANMAVAAMLLARTKKTIIDGQEPTETEICLDLGLGYASPYDRSVEGLASKMYENL